MEPNTDIQQENEQISTNLISIKSTIEEIKADLEGARNFINDVGKYSITFTELKEKLDDPIIGLDPTLEAAHSTKRDIDEIKVASESIKSDILNLATSIDSTIKLVDESYKSFVSLDEKINNESTGLQASLTKSQNLKQEIEDCKTSIEGFSEETKIILGRVRDVAGEASETYSDFLKTKGDIDNPDTGLEAILATSTKIKQEIVAVQGQTKGLYEGVLKFRDESNVYHKQIIAFKDEAETKVSEIKKHEEESNDYKQKIAKIYEIATGSGLANSFDKRKNELTPSVKLWYLTLLISTSLLIIVILAIYFTALYKGTIGDYLFYYRLSISSPLIFFIIFATERYTHERNLLERYAFKATTAFALESYSTLLKNTFSGKEHEIQILDFVINSMQTIYKEPFDVKKETKLIVGLNSKLGDIKAEILETKIDIDMIKKSLENQLAGNKTKSVKNESPD